MQARPTRWTAILAGCLIATLATRSLAADWPTWRGDATRTAVTTADLPNELHLAWTLENPRLTPAWAEDVRLHFDAAYEPVVVGSTMYLAASHNDSITAYDTATGEQKWRFHAAGPVRFAPTVHQGQVYFGADDGHLYCVDAASGKLGWRVRLAPNGRQVLGNERLISVWPVRGGAVVYENQLHVTTGVWPFEGTFLHSVDLSDIGPLGDDPAANAQRVEASLRSVVLPTDLAPQGYLVGNAGRIFIPCGRSNAACFDLASGRFLTVRYDSKGKTDYHVSARGPWLLHGERIVHVDDQRMGQMLAPRPVVTDQAAYFPQEGAIVAYDLQSPEVVVGKDRRGRPVESLKLVEAWRLANQQIIEVPSDKFEYEIWLRENPLHVGLLAGGRLFGHQADHVFAIDLPTDSAAPECRWSTSIDGTPVSLVAADDKLFVSTLEGKIHCFAGRQPSEPSHVTQQPEPSTADEAIQTRAARIAALAPDQGGYGLIWGAGDSELIDGLLDESDLRWIAAEADQATADRLRARLDGQTRYGRQAAVMQAAPLESDWPPYLASLVVVADAKAAGMSDATDFARRLFQVLRPYGGTACLLLDDAQHDALAEAVEAADLPRAKLSRLEGLTTLVREGALPGASDWTHEYGDATNSLMSQDNLVKAPLGLLWFGGPSSDNRLYFDRHDWGPSMAVVEGRIFIQGPKILSAVDVYTGRMLWQKELRDGQGRGRRGNFTTAGYHFVTVPDGLYLAYNDVCLWLDPATGEQLGEFRLPKSGDEFGNFRIYDELLIAAAFRAVDGADPAPAAIVALNRRTGDEVWSRDADFAFPFFAVGAGKVFCVDGMLEKLYQDMRRRGLVPKAASERQLIALDVETGEPIWTQPLELVATWLGYSEDRDILVASNKQGIIGLMGSSGQVLWQRNDEADGFGGHPESVWDKVILAGDRVIDQRGPGMAYFIETGEPVTEPHPVTGESVPWKFNRQGHHCNYAIANPHLITFRAADAGFCDLTSSGSSRLYGFRSGCRNSLLPAGGVLNAPNFASGCVCGYSLFTSLSLVHVPEADMWQYAAIEASDLPVARVGINLGAPGSRRDPEGSLWLDYPRSSTTPLDLPVELKGDSLSWYREHVSSHADASLPWVVSSGVEGATALSVDLGKDIRDQRAYTVRLYFAEPEPQASTPRVFDIAIQGVLVREDVDLQSATAAEQGGLIVEVPGVQVASQLTVELIPKQGRTVLCGVEAIAERP